jgi:regulator of protease activity HflC (stomatin/prohibitin superfamily)
MEAAKSVIAHADAPAANHQLTRRRLCNIIDQQDLDEVPQERSKINGMLRESTGSSTESWGLRVDRNLPRQGAAS